MAGKQQWGSRSIEMFEKLEQVGEGTYGQVYKARNKDTGEVVALKRVRMDNEKEGFPITAIREIKILKILNHKNVVRLKEIVTSKGSDYNQGKGSIYMVMEFLEHDLTGLTDAGQRFTVPQIKCYMKQLLEGLAYCHAQKVLHRDIKGSNLLISNDGQLKLADFGLARPFDTDQQRPYTNRVITLWYRPPELLLGATMYGPMIDMWSAGCIFAELLLRKPILPGKNEFEQIDLIFKLLGTPDEAVWPKCSKLQYYDMILSQNGGRKYSSRFEDKFRDLEPHAKDLLRKLLSMDPEKRITADDALDHEYFWTDPAPATPDQLPKYPTSHEFTAKKRRQQNAAAQQQQNQQPLQPTGQQGTGASVPLPVSQGYHHPQSHQGQMAHYGPPGGGGPPGHHLPHHSQQHPNQTHAQHAQHAQHPQHAQHAHAYPPQHATYNGGGGGGGGASSNPFYAARHASGGAGAPPGYGQGGNGYGAPPAKRPREGPHGHDNGGGGGFFSGPPPHANGGQRHSGHGSGGYPGGGWPQGQQR